MVKRAYDYAVKGIPNLTKDRIDGSRISYFSDHFSRQLKAASMVQDYLGLNPKGSVRIEWGGATGGECFQAAYEAVASGRMDVCLAAGFETMSRVATWKGNEFIALASDTNFDFPLGGFYTGYYALMVMRHIYEYLRLTRFAHVKDEREAQRLAIQEGSRIMSMVSVKNHRNALHNPYAQYPKRLTVEEVLRSEMISYPLTREQICTMSDGAAVAFLCSESAAREFTDRPVLVKGVGCGTDTMRLADRPFGIVPRMPHESAKDYSHLPYPGVHSFRAGRAAGLEAYRMAGITDPNRELDFVELHDAYASSEIQTYEDLGLCRVRRRIRVRRAGRPVPARDRLRVPHASGGRRPGEPVRRIDRVRPSGRGDRPDAGGLRPLAAPGDDPRPLRGPRAPTEGPQAGGDPQPRRYRIERDRLDPESGGSDEGASPDVHEVSRRTGRARQERCGALPRRGRGREPHHPVSGTRSSTSIATPRTPRSS